MAKYQTIYLRYFLYNIVESEKEEIIGVEIVLGNAYEEIKKIPDHSVDLIVTDPPYLIASHSKNPKNNIGRSMKQTMDELMNCNIMDGIRYEILDEFVRVLKKINVYIFCNKKQILPYLKYFVEQKGCSFEILVWIKTNPVPCCGNGYLKDKEYCLYFRKDKHIDTRYERAHTYWITPINKADKKKYLHPTVKPQFMIEQLILNSSAPQEVVLDPFLGSGTTAAAAAKLNRQFIGYEILETHYQTAKERVKAIGS